MKWVIILGGVAIVGAAAYYYAKQRGVFLTGQAEPATTRDHRPTGARGGDDK